MDSIQEASRSGAEELFATEQFPVFTAATVAGCTGARWVEGDIAGTLFGVVGVFRRGSTRSRSKAVARDSPKRRVI